MSENSNVKEIHGILIKLLSEKGLWRETLGKRTSQFVLACLIIAVVEFTYNLPIITLSTAPIVGALLIFLWDSVAVWLQSDKPEVIYFACPKERKFIEIAWSKLPKYRKYKTCECGAKLIKRCPSGKHFIVSPLVNDEPNTDTRFPKPDSVCPYCDPSNEPYIPHKH